MSENATLLDHVISGERRALARAITLVESSNPQHRKEAVSLLDALPARARPAIRIGLSGTPGVGKSTFIESMGMFLAQAGHKVAVLAVDPSSGRTGGSILGDKTRMPMLARHPNAYIRPSPSGGFLGGVARHTRDAIHLVEAAGFDIILIETVGVGQSETAVSRLSDLFVLLLAPGGGDELQGIKRGIMELADFVVVNKADGDLQMAAARAVADHQSAMRLMKPRFHAWAPEVHKVSAISQNGIPELWLRIEEAIEKLERSGEFAQQRSAQNVSAFHDELAASITAHFLNAPDYAAMMKILETKVATGDFHPAVAVYEALAQLGLT